MPLVRFLGEEGLAYDGGDITWYAPTPFTSALTLSYGEVLSHGHGEGEEEEEAEEILFNDEVFTANLLTKVNYNDFNQFAAGGSIATGDNEFGDETDVYGLYASYTWRENGLEPGGRFLTWNNELFWRDYGVGAGHGHGHEEEEESHHDEDEDHEDEDDHEDEGHEDEGHEDEHADEDDHGDEEGHEPVGDDEFGLFTELIYGTGSWLDAGVRLGYVSGIDEVDLDERFRVSPLATIYLSKQRNLFLRLQYNYDDLEHGEEAHSAWAQLQYSFGTSEVR